LFCLFSYIGGIVLYYFLGVFKKLANSEQVDLILDANEPEEILSSEEAAFTTKAGSIIYILLGSLIWATVAYCAGKLSLKLNLIIPYAWLCHILMYFFLLIFPFGVLNKTIEKTYEIENNFEKIIFAVIVCNNHILQLLAKHTVYRKPTYEF